MVPICLRKWLLIPVRGKGGWDFNLDLLDGSQHLPFSRSRRGRTLVGLLLSSVQASLCPSPAGRPCRPPLKKRFIRVLERCKAPFSPEDPDFSFFRCFFSSVDTREPPRGLEGGQRGGGGAQKRAERRKGGGGNLRLFQGGMGVGRAGSSSCFPSHPTTQFQGCRESRMYL